ncbi:hypothetical protein HDV02_005000 [Globomyces sp. JEL0801]|nr:hypothetical protein HDV02_005000 [Globomyces sp. JEL0801]
MSKNILSRKPSSQQQSDYVRNLQQQIYLLELETRYMKAGKKPPKGKSMDFLSKSQNFTSNANLMQASNMMMNACPELDNQESEVEENQLEEMNKTIANLKTNEGKLKAELEDLIKKNLEMKENIKELEDKSVADKDQLRGDLIASKQKHEELTANVAHLNIAYERVNKERESIAIDYSELRSESKQFKQKIDEQIAINEELIHSLEKCQQSNQAQSARLHDLELTIDGIDVESYKKQINDLQNKLAKSVSDFQSERLEKENILSLQTQLKETAKQHIQKSTKLESELDLIRIELDKERNLNKSKRSMGFQDSRIEDDKMEKIIQLQNQLKMAKISCETKDRMIETLSQNVKTLEKEQIKDAETLKSTLEKLDQFDALNRNRSHELIQLGQDKSILQDELAETKNQYDRIKDRMKTLTIESDNLKQKVSNFEIESQKWNEFATILDQVESSGANYLAMMKGFKSKIHH